jgi:hypothetical protein
MIHTATVVTPDIYPNNSPEENLEVDSYLIDHNLATNHIKTCTLLNNSHTYTYTPDLLQLDECVESTPELLPAQALKITTPLVADQWELLLKDHPDR